MKANTYAAHIKISETEGISRMSPKSLLISKMYNSAQSDEISPKRQPSRDVKVRS